MGRVFNRTPEYCEKTNKFSWDTTVGLIEDYRLSRAVGNLGKTIRGGSMLIAEIDKNQKEKIRITIEEYRGARFIDCRVYFEDENGGWKPTKKGIALNGESIDPVIKALRKASKELKG